MRKLTPTQAHSLHSVTERYTTILTDEPISQVLRADIHAKKHQTRDYTAELEESWNRLEQRLQQHAAWVMGAAILVLYLGALLTAGRVPHDYRSFMHMFAWIFLLWFCAKYLAIRIGIYHPLMRYIDTVYQLSMLSFFLYISESTLGGDFALSSSAPLLYILLIAAAGLSFNPRHCLFAGILAALEYLAVYGLLVTHGPGWKPLALHTLALLVVGFVAMLLTRHARHTAASISAELQQQARSDIATLELEQAAEIQEKLIPPKNPDIDFLEVASFYLPSREVGGDYFDFIRREDNDWLLAIGDVSGKGFAAAILMSNIQAIVQVLAKQAAPLEEIADALNKAVLKTSSRGRFVTLALIQFCRQQKQLRYINCGHNAPITATPDKHIYELQATAPILGIQAGIDYQSKLLDFPEDSTLIAYTDGLSELRSPEGAMFEEDTITAVLSDADATADAQALKDNMLRKVRRHMGKAQPGDDLSFVCVKARWNNAET